MRRTLVVFAVAYSLTLNFLFTCGRFLAGRAPTLDESARDVERLLTGAVVLLAVIAWPPRDSS